jgi:hypothetical protein
LAKKTSRVSKNYLTACFAAPESTDSLPDKFGSQLIDTYMADKDIPASQITTLDRLLYIGGRGMGALEYHPAQPLDNLASKDITLDINTLAELASLVTSKNTNQQSKLLEAKTRQQALKLIRVGSSAGGARSKAVVALAQLCNLDKRKATPIIERTLTAFAGFEKLANEYDIDASLTKTICNSLRLNIPALLLLDAAQALFVIANFIA